VDKLAPTDSGITNVGSGLCGKRHRLDRGRAHPRSDVSPGSETRAEFRACVGRGSPTPPSGATKGLQTARTAHRGGSKPFGATNSIGRIRWRTPWTDPRVTAIGPTGINHLVRKCR
jgi:hypothetical protein